MRERLRLDEAIVKRGLAPSRSRARDAILRGHVRVDGAAVTKPGKLVAEDADLSVSDPGLDYVSRGALKLIAALDAFGFDPSGRDCLDIGASTGGFTQVLLERGAQRVVAVDVGHGQLAEALQADARVVGLEGTDARALRLDDIGGPVQAIAIDVSFISITHILPAVLSLAADGCWLVALVKPQFEVGRAGLDRRGIVRDPALRDAAIDRVTDLIRAAGWRCLDPIVSPISGGDGNVETLLGAVRDMSS